MKFGKRGLSIVIGACLLLIGSLLVFWLLGYRAYFVISPSMGQTAPVGSLAIVKAQSEYYEQDIITFYRGTRVYTHRIVGRKEGKYVTKGDINKVPDSILVSRSDIIGKTLVLSVILVGPGGLCRI